MINTPEVQKQRYLSLKEAAEQIQSGDTIWLGSMLNIPNAFLYQLAKRNTELRDVTLLGNMLMMFSPLLRDPEFMKSFHLVSFEGYPLFRGANTKHINCKQIPKEAQLQNICEMFKLNTLATEICPPDEQGNCDYGSFGADITAHINCYEGITKRIAVINSYQTAGKCKSRPLRDFDFICECNHKLHVKASNISKTA
ncbi:MAG: CoA transferase [Oscillospiraceae bacterium]